MVHTSPTQPIKVLIVEDNLDYATMLQVILEATPGQFEPHHVSTLRQALGKLRQGSMDVILLDLSLPDCSGLDSFLQIYAHTPEVPVVVLTVENDQDMAIKTIQKGAQDYLVKGEFDPKSLIRSLLYAIERHRTLLLLQQLSLSDDLTNLLNRRGFLSLAQQQIKIAQRAEWESVLFFADLDGLKEINDTHGHPEGDRALRAVANILRNTFRTSDLIGRLGGDEFIVLAINASEGGIETITTRLEENVQRYNENNHGYRLSMSYGIAKFDARSNYTLEELIALADEDLYEYKRSKSKNSH